MQECGEGMGKGVTSLLEFSVDATRSQIIWEKSDLKYPGVEEGRSRRSSRFLQPRRNLSDVECDVLQYSTRVCHTCAKTKSTGIGLCQY